MPLNSVLEAFLQNSQNQPDKVCLDFEGQSLSYDWLRNRLGSIAAGLTSWGLQAGDRVALFLENCPDFIAAYLGIQAAGGIVVLVNTQYRQVELRHIINDAGVRLCFTDQERRPELDKLRDDLPTLEKIITVEDELADFLAASLTKLALPERETVAVIAYTSGTTGRSKGAMLTHANLISNVLAVIEAWRWTADDNLLLTLPLFHTHGLMVGAHGSLVAGGSIFLQRRFEASRTYDSLLNMPVTMFFGVPTMYTRLLAEAAMREQKPPRLRLYVSGSAPLTPTTFAEFQKVFGASILERYGMTETIMNLTNPYEGERRPGTVGQPFPGQEARVVDVRSRQPLPPNEPGEIEVRGPHVFRGYWNRPDATAESFDPDGWFRTGDLGSYSADGYFTISGRAKELIISGGYNVYPREVEEVLEKCPGVAEVAVIGEPEADLGEQVVAVVVASDPNLTAAALITFCRDQLASYKKPRRVVFVDSLPRNALGKVQKHLISYPKY